VADEISKPLGVDLWIGLPESEEARVSPLSQDPPSADVGPALRAAMAAVMGPGTRGGRALSLSGAFGINGTFNKREVHAAEIPAANAITNAASLARVYAATLGPIDGIQLMDAATRDRARTQVTPDGEPDLCLMMPTTFGLGFMVDGQFTMYAGPGCYGHPGGSVAFADPACELSFAYVVSTMATNLAGDLRAQNLIDAAAAVADGG